MSLNSVVLLHPWVALSGQARVPELHSSYEKASKKKASKIFEKLSKDYRRCGSDFLLLFLRLYIPR